MALSVELITLLGSTVLGGGLKLWAAASQARKDKDMAMLQALNANASIMKDAREYENEGFQWTRNLVAIIAIVSIIALPIIGATVAQFMDKPFVMTHGWTEWQNGFLFFTEGKDVMKWHQITGVAITPMHTQLVAAIAGLFFGATIVGNRR